MFCLHDDKVPFFFCFSIIHLIFTLTFHFFVLRHVEKYLGWLRTALIYLGSGIGGNIVSAVFVPYNPEVRLSRDCVAVVVINLERKSTVYRAMERSTLGNFTLI